MTDQEIREPVTSIAESQREMDRQMQETDRQLKELGRKMDGLGDKFGSYIDGLALPSMTKVLAERFHMGVVLSRVRAQKNGLWLEVDVLAYSNSGGNEVYVVEVKGRLREEAIDRMKRIFREFRDFFPSHRDKRVYGILAAVDAPDEVHARVLAEGIYLARIHDGQFELQVPDNFQPRAF